MPLRPSYESIPHSSSSQLIAHQIPNLQRLYPLFARLTFYVIPGKLDGELENLYRIIDELGGKVVSLEHARFVLTAIRGRPRLLRALGSYIDSKTILSVEFVHDTYQRCLEAVESPRCTPPSLPLKDPYFVKVSNPAHSPASTPTKRPREDGDASPGSDSQKKRKIKNGEERTSDLKFPSDDKSLAVIDDELPDMELLDPDVNFEDIPRLCVHRACPLISVNQDIINAIKPIYDDREFEERQQKNTNVLSYRRSVSILKSVPRPIKSGKEARKLQDLGERVAERIDEFLESGQIQESQEILQSARHHTLTDFASVYTIGHATAKELYDRHHCRSLADVREHYLNIAEESEEVRLKVKARRQREGGMTHADIVEEWMKVKDELDTKIPRSEVQEIADLVMEHLSAFLSECRYTICGGYRRGKTQCGDVDIVFCPPEEGQDIGLLKDLYLRLSDLNIITHVLHVTQRSANAPIHSSANNFDNLDKAFVIFKLPGPGRLHRRVDLISSPKERYAAAVLSWSGSMMFERDLRRHAETMGLKFRAGLVEAKTGREIHLETEREIFHYLGLRYVPPELRNADA